MTDDVEKNAAQIFEQVKTLWDDQADLAETLRNRRKVLSSLLAVLLGLGLFKLEFWAPEGRTAIIDGRSVPFFRWLIVSAICLFTLAVYFLHTQRPTLRRIAYAIWHCLKRRTKWLYLKARAPERSQEIKVDPPPKPRWPEGRSLSTVLPDNEDLEDWCSMAPIELIFMRAERLRAAYDDLRSKNLRVSRRLKEGIFCTILGFLTTFAGITIYVFELTDSDNDARIRQQSEAQNDVKRGTIGEGNSVK